MYIKRKLEDTIREYMNKPEILAIVGPRQAGKTTLLKKIQTELQSSIFLSFEDREDLELFEQDIKSFAKKYLHYKYVFIDEFQYSKIGGKNLKYLFDTYPKVKIIISGSSAIDLTIRAIKYLVGRVFVFNLYQLDFEEYLQFKDKNLFRLYLDYKKIFAIKNGLTGLPKVAAGVNREINILLKEFILWGGYPRVVLSENEEEKKIVLKNIYNTYFLRDVRDMLGLSDDFRFGKLIKALSIQVGQLVSYNELGFLAGYDYLTLKKYLNLLEKTFICQMVSPYFTNKRKEIIKNPKIYFFDTGLRNYTIGDFTQIDNRSDKGFLYENFIFEQCLKQEIPTNYWRTKMKAEVDFIIEIANKKIPIESKSKFSERKISKSLKSFIVEHKPEYALILNENSIEKIQLDETAIYLLPHWIV